MKSPNIKTLQARARVWCKRLKLQDWRIRVRWAQVGEQDAQATVSIGFGAKSAVISILPLQYSEEGTRDPLELTLLHELLHLHLEGLMRTRPERTEMEIDMLEQAICAIASGLFATEYPNWVDESHNL